MQEDHKAHSITIQELPLICAIPHSGEENISLLVAKYSAVNCHLLICLTRDTDNCQLCCNTNTVTNPQQTVFKPSERSVSPKQLYKLIPHCKQQVLNCISIFA